MIISLWTRDLEIPAATATLLQEWILVYLAKRPSERESISHLVGEVRTATRLKFPTNNNDAGTTFEALGFTLVKERNAQGAILRTYVTV